MRAITKRWGWGISLLCAWVVAGARAAQATEIRRDLVVPATIDLGLIAEDCTSSPGPKVTISGDMSFGGLGVDLIFRNGRTPAETTSPATSVSAAVMIAGELLQIPEQSILGGAGGHPFIWMQLMDADGRPLTSEVYIGRCGQEELAFQASFALPVTAATRISTTDCSKSPGPNIIFDGGVITSGLHAQLIFRNNSSPISGPQFAAESLKLNLVLLPAGQGVSFSRQPVQGGVGGNPWIWALLRDADGEPVGREQLMGQCQQLSERGTGAGATAK